MESSPALFEATPAAAATDAEDEALREVEAWFRAQPSMVSRFASALRQSIDEVLDGQRTGRFDVTTLEKTEKTYLGTKVEIILRAEFALGRGTIMDYRIDGREVDAKFTLGTNWTIPREAMGHVCLLMSADDHHSRFRVGLLRIGEDELNPGRNQDGKRSISLRGRAAIRWLVPDGQLPENLLLSIPEADRAAIFAASEGHHGPGNGGQLRINELLRRVQGRMIDRTTAITVARQLDGPKRVRDARLHLRGEGIIVLGHQDDHPRIARALGLPVPAKGSWIAVQLVTPQPSDERPQVLLGSRPFVIARPGEPPQNVPLV